MNKIIVLCASCICYCWGFGIAQAEQYGQWITDTTSAEQKFAATFNDSGSLLGQYCYASNGMCYWIVSMDSKCEDGHEYPTLVNSDTGAVQLTLVCSGAVKNSTNYRYIFKNFDAIEDVVSKNKSIGFAVPMESGRFRVVRFLLDGADESIAALQQAAAKAISKTPSNTKDQTL